MFTGLTIIFLKDFFFGLKLTYPVLVTLAAAIVALGQLAGRMEGWSAFDSFYWAFVTATTVGYGDMTPKRRSSRILVIFIALLGLVFTGILIAVAVNAGGHALKIRMGELLK